MIRTSQLAGRGLYNTSPCSKRMPSTCRNQWQQRAASTGDNGSSTSTRAPDAPHAAAAAASSSPPAGTSGRGDQLPKAAAFSCLLVAAGVTSYTVLSTQPELPPVGAVVTTLAAAAAAVAGAAAAAALVLKLALRDRFHLELHRGKLYVLVGVPSQGPAVEAGAVVVRPTGIPELGNGAVSALHFGVSDQLWGLGGGARAVKVYPEQLKLPRAHRHTATALAQNQPRATHSNQQPPLLPRLNTQYAARRIPSGTHLGDYSGELLDRAAFFKKCECAGSPFACQL
jgi:hypothetical protein